MLDGEPVDVGEAVEVVDLVLEAAGEGAGALQADRLAVQVDSGDGGGGGAGQVGLLSRDGQTSLGVGHEFPVLG